MLFRTLPLWALLGSVLAKPTCSGKYRKAELNGVAPAFNAPEAQTAAFLEQLPLKDDAQLLLYIDGAPGVAVARTGDTVRAFAFGVRQIFYKVSTTSHPKSTNYANGTTHTELEIVTGLISMVPFPVTFHVGMNFNYDLSDCLLNTVQGYLTIPDSIAGQPVNATAVVDDIMAAGYAGTLPSS